jgi:hypothetical protein
MRRLLAVMMAVAVAGLVTSCSTWKCGGKAKPVCAKGEKPKCDMAKPACAKGAKAECNMTLCGKCGELKGSDACCKADAKVCDQCGLHKGSPGCCAGLTKGQDAQLCPKCGEIKGTDKCCKADIESCKKCGMHKGSPCHVACCKSGCKGKM